MDQKCKGLFSDSQFHSIDLQVYHYANDILSWLPSPDTEFLIWEVTKSSNFVILFIYLKHYFYFMCTNEYYLKFFLREDRYNIKTK